MALLISAWAKLALCTFGIFIDFSKLRKIEPDTGSNGATRICADTGLVADGAMTLIDDIQMHIVKRQIMRIIS